MLETPAIESTHICHIHGTMPENQFYRCVQKSRHGKEVVAWRCKTCSKAKRAARYHKDPETSKAKTLEWKQSHRERANAITNESYHRNKEKYLPKFREKRSDRRISVIRHYSPDVKCALCGDRHDRFLVLDHIDGGGTRHRHETTGLGDKFYRWIVKEGYPPGFRVLCHNCNFKECIRLNRERFESKNWEQTHKTRIIDGKGYPVDKLKLALADRKYKAAIKLECLVRYSSIIPSCACCGLDDEEILSIDHIDGGGRKHRKEEAGNGNRFYVWLRDNGFPSGYRVYCLNCNFAYGAFKSCPHKQVEPTP